MSPFGFLMCLRKNNCRRRSQNHCEMWYSTYAHRDFFIFHLKVLFTSAVYSNSCIFRVQNDDQFVEQCHGKTLVFSDSFAFYGSICNANAWLFCWYSFTSDFVWPKNYISWGIESKRLRRITLCKILPFSCDISWPIKLFMLWPHGYLFRIKIVRFLIRTNNVDQAVVGLTWFNDVRAKR